MVAALAVATVGCSSSSSNSSSTSTPPNDATPADEEQFVDWLGKAGEISLACHEASRNTDGVLDGHSEVAQGEDHSVDAVMAAGQAVEHCGFAFEEEMALVSQAEMESTWTAGTVALAAWLDEMEATNRAAVLVAAGNMDNRHLVGELYELQASADTLAEEFEALVLEQAQAFGLEVDTEGLGLHRWDPPEH